MALLRWRVGVSLLAELCAAPFQKEIQMRVQVPQKPPHRTAERRNRFVMECHKHRLVLMQSGSWNWQGQITRQKGFAGEQGPHALV